MRVGIGFDIHQLALGKPLVVGGVTIENAPKGARGWSDADALTHAVCDALLGAAALGDIGHHFPPGDEKYKGINSQELLKRVCQMLSGGNFRIANVDTVVILERPSLKDCKPEIARVLAESMGIAPHQVGVKATTHEGMGSIGQGDAIAAHAVALLEES